VSQPALSESIRKLEKELGVPLVYRGHAFEGLTPEGERLVLWARRILADHDALVQEVAAMQSGLDGQLRLAVIPSASTTVALLIEAFRAAHPLASVLLETRLSSYEISQRLHRFELDVGVVHLSEPAVSELNSFSIYTERFMLVANRQLVDDDVDLVAWSELSQLPLCMLNTSMRGRQLVDEALGTSGLTLRPDVETDSMASLYALAQTGRYVAVAPHSWFHAFPLAADVRLVPLVSPAVTSAVGLVTSASEPGSVLGRAFAAVAGRLALDDVFDVVLAR
jgi:DNA-binding transcriptional LysR family regulator